MHPDPGIPARRSARHEIVLPTRLQVCREHAAQVAFRGSAIWSGEAVDADLMNLSGVGVALISNRFVPVGCLLRIRIYGLNNTHGAALVDGRVRVQRSEMTDSRPGYLVGASFEDDDGVFRRDLDLLLKRLENAPDEEAA